MLTSFQIKLMIATISLLIALMGIATKMHQRTSQAVTQPNSTVPDKFVTVDTPASTSQHHDR